MLIFRQDVWNGNSEIFRAGAIKMIFSNAWSPRVLRSEWNLHGYKFTIGLRTRFEITFISSSTLSESSKAVLLRVDNIIRSPKNTWIIVSYRFVIAEILSIWILMVEVVHLVLLNTLIFLHTVIQLLSSQKVTACKQIFKDRLYT